jgi:autotransporter-associated beta strand protein
MVLRLVAFCLGLLLLSAVSVARQPNIVLIYLDDAAYREVGFAARHFNQPTDFLTPNIDALARRSTIVSNGYCSYPICGPSRAGLLTGLHQSRFGFEYNVSDGAYPDGLSGEQRIIPSYLKELGYETGAIGKWHLGTHDGINRPLDLGFDEFYGFLSGGRNYWQYSGAVTTAYAMRRGDTPIEHSWGSEGNHARYDPVRGRYLTDAFGEEAASFITRHAQGEDPFFLYMALNAPHVPLQSKQADLDRFAHIADPNEQRLAAMMYAADRAVGDVVNAVRNNGISDDTVIVLANDNGGTTPYDNDPFNGGKGQLLEGGIRVPFLIHAPGVTARTYNRPISTLDLLPTFVSLAGGDASALQTDGVDVLPYLRGARGGDPHEVLYWRSVGNRFAVRRGDWKLTRPQGGTGPPKLFDLGTDPGERVDLSSQYPLLVEEMLRDLTNWEARMDKPRWGSFGAPTKNRFDHFVFRSGNSSQAAWSTAGQWRQVSGAPATLQRDDAYANAVLEFQTTDSNDYVATNDMRRATLEKFMLNEIRFTGQYAGRAEHNGTINGNDLLFVNSLDGLRPRVLVAATATQQVGSFTFYLDNQLELLDELEIGGDGTQLLEIRGSIVDYHEPRGISKTGASRVRLSGHNTYSGNTTVEGGALALGGPTLDDSAAVRLFSGATLELDFSGVDTIRALYIDGRPQAAGIWGAPGNSVAQFHSDILTGDGVLSVASLGLTGDFNGDGAVNTADYVVWRKHSGPRLDPSEYGDWRASFGKRGVGREGDFNHDGTVDAADYVLWRKSLSNLFDPSDFGDWSSNYGDRFARAGDFNGNGAVDSADYVIWRKGLGTTYTQGDYQIWRANFGVNAAILVSAWPVPEPSCLSLSASALWLLRCGRGSGARVCRKDNRR